MDDLDGLAESDEVPTLLAASGVFDTHYEFRALPLTTGPTIEVIPVAYINDRLLVAVPHTTWHRTTAKRILPSHALQKPQVVEVVACLPDQREVGLEVTMKIWMGFLAEDLVGKLCSMDMVETTDYVFLTGDLPSVLPLAESLTEAAQEHFAFVSAAEHEEDDQEESKEKGRDGYGSEKVLESRMDKMEDALARIASTLDKLNVEQPDRVHFAPEPRRSALRRPKSSGSIAEKFPMMDQSVVAAAISAGVGEDALMEMQKVLGGAAARGKQLGEPPLRLTPKAAPKKNELSESESEEEVEVVASGSAASTDGAPTLARSLKKLTKIVSVLTEDKVKKSKVSKVEAALDGISASGYSETGGLGTGKKAAAARRVLRSSLTEAPEELYTLIERYMMEDLALQTLTPGQPSSGLSCRAWIEHRSRIGSYKTAAYCSWAAGGIHDALMQGNIAQARARVALLVLMLDQTAFDRGSWALSSELSLEPPPPMGALSQHHPPAVGDGEAPWSRLLDPRWAEVCLSHLREAEDYLSKRSKLGKKGSEEDSAAAAKAKAKAKQKASGGGSNPDA